MTTIDFTLGADPEFICLSKKTGVLIPAYKSIGACKANKESRYFGHDGCARVFEVRPVPSFEPVTVVSSIREIIRSFAVLSPKYLDYQFRAGSFVKGNPIGGHIHFGLKSTESYYDKYCKILSDYVGTLTLLLEDPVEARGRRKWGDYGSPTDYRTQFHGFEYRTPSSWITSPHIALGVLSLAKLVMLEVLNNPNYEFVDCTKEVPSYESEFMRAEVSNIKKIVPKLKKSLQNMRFANLYWKDIKILFDLIENNKNWFPSCGFLEAWGITKEPKQTITMEDIWGKA